MTEFGAAATLSFEPARGEIQAIRQEVEAELSDLEIGFDPGTPSQQLAQPDGGRQTSGLMSDVVDPLETLVELNQLQLEELEELADLEPGGGGGRSAILPVGAAGGGIGAAGLGGPAALAIGAFGLDALLGDQARAAHEEAGTDPIFDRIEEAGVVGQIIGMQEAAWDAVDGEEILREAIDEIGIEPSDVIGDEAMVSPSDMIDAAADVTPQDLISDGVVVTAADVITSGVNISISDVLTEPLDGGEALRGQTEGEQALAFRELFTGQRDPSPTIDIPHTERGVGDVPAAHGQGIDTATTPTQAQRIDVGIDSDLDVTIQGPSQQEIEREIDRRLNDYRNRIMDEVRDVEEQIRRGIRR